MSAISDFVAKQKAFNVRQGTAIDALGTSVVGITDDIKALLAKILELQNSTGEVTPEDAALINELETQGEALVARTESAAQAFKTLDESNPPTPPQA